MALTFRSCTNSQSFKDLRSNFDIREGAFLSLKGSESNLRSVPLCDKHPQIATAPTENVGGFASRCVGSLGPAQQGSLMSVAGREVSGWSVISSPAAPGPRLALPSLGIEGQWKGRRTLEAFGQNWHNVTFANICYVLIYWWY